LPDRGLAPLARRTGAFWGRAGAPFGAIDGFHARQILIAQRHPVGSHRPRLARLPGVRLVLSGIAHVIECLLMPTGSTGCLAPQSPYELFGTRPALYGFQSHHDQPGGLALHVLLELLAAARRAQLDVDVVGEMAIEIDAARREKRF